MAVDLHIHTTASDGALSPSSIVDAALDLGLTAIAITDHDSVEGISEAQAAASGTALEIIPGVELSVLAADRSDIHLLGFLIDPASAALLATLERLREYRQERAMLMVQRLAAAGHPIDFASVAHHANGGAVGRVHVARALVESGSVDSVEHAFATLIGRDRPFYVGKTTLSSADAIAVVHRARGVAVIAHPGISGAASITSMALEGLDGIEAFHAEHSAEQRDDFARMASRLGLIATGGSDFHGPGLRSAMLGAGDCPPSAVVSLRERARLLHS